jgi:methylene-tetrahydromethanopterin dehydrogenase
MLSPLKHMSPFDVNMAIDAGFNAAIPYTQVTTQEVTGLVQDAIFSRAPQDGVRTGIFIGGKDAVMALDMMAAATAALVPPFAVSIFADPAGSFTTAAAMAAFVERVLTERFGRGLQDVNVKIFGGTGVVAFSAAVILAQTGARVTLVGHDGSRRVAAAAAEIQRRFGVNVESADGSSEDLKAELVRDAEVILCCGPAGVHILSRRQLEGATRLLVAADLNAVPPPGIEGLSPMERATPLGIGQAVGIGALAIGDLKYRTETALFRRMIEAEAPVAFDFRDAFKLARELAAG